MERLDCYGKRIKSNILKDYEKERKNMTLYSVIIFLTFSLCFWKKYFDSMALFPLFDNFRMLWLMWAVLSTLCFFGALGLLIYNKVVK